MTKKKLIRIIKEEIEAVLREFDPGPRYQYREEPHVPRRLSDEEIEALRLAQTPEMKRRRALKALNTPGVNHPNDAARHQAAAAAAFANSLRLQRYGDMNALQQLYYMDDIDKAIDYDIDYRYRRLPTDDELARVASDARSLDPDQMYDAAQIAAADRAAEQDYITKFSADKKSMNQG